ncbi:hypothetical protein [Maribacter sp. 2307ULW6-5]|uniref:hypothetical protein n=1 Tax=Maribacter sp. 2307ULW6-5 TaxID=3386275 RepID=UPI0039BD6C27
MKYVLLIVVALAISLPNDAAGQNISFGATGGLLSGGEKFKSGSESVTASDTGFYLGLTSKIPLSGKFTIAPEADYGRIENSSFLFVAGRVHYFVLPKFYLQLGPQVTYLFDDLNDAFSQAGLDISSGVGYEINDHFGINARYSFEITNRSKLEFDDVSSRLRWLMIGIEYVF